MTLEYIYTLNSTAGTTGFVSCVPVPAISLDTAVELLGERPLDTFLHRHALNLLRALPATQWPQWARLARERSLRPLAALLLELGILNTQAREILRPQLAHLAELATPWQENTPETILARSPKADADGWRANIQAHAATPPILTPSADLLPARDTLFRRQGLLANQKALLASGASNPRDNAACLKLAEECLAKSGAALGVEMRHEASLCPIALLQSWHLEAQVAGGRNDHTLSGEAIAYGRGLKLAQARISCRMEILERHCAHARIGKGGAWGKVNGVELARASWRELTAAGRAAVSPDALGAPIQAEDLPLYWLPAQDSAGQEVLVPAQAVFLFCNLDEVTLLEHIGSTGLAAGASLAGARLHALVEILERYAQATTAFGAENCFELDSEDPVLHGLLEDYRWRGIRVQFQDITPEWGIPAYRCFVQGKDGALAQGTGAALDGAKAAIAALTETPWPYVWAKPMPAPSGPGLPQLPRRRLEHLPNFSLGNEDLDLRLLENTLKASGLRPLYVQLNGPETPLPVCRAFIPGLELDTELEMGPSLTLLARSKYFSKGHNCA